MRSRNNTLARLAIYARHSILVSLSVAGLFAHLRAQVVPLGTGADSTNGSQGNVVSSRNPLCDPTAFTPTAERLAKYCQSDRALFPRKLTYAWLPEEVSRGSYRFACTFDSDAAKVEFDGRFFDFGYELERD